MSGRGPAGESGRPAPGARARLLGVCAAGLVPWLVIRSGGAWSLVLSFGLASPTTLHLTPVWTYLLELTWGLPAALLAWPVAGLLYLVGLASAAAGLAAGREDRRLTGGLLVLAGLSLLPVAGAVGRPRGVLAVPVGLAALWLVAWWGYRDALVRVVRDGGGPAG